MYKVWQQSLHSFLREQSHTTRTLTRLVQAISGLIDKDLHRSQIMQDYIDHNLSDGPNSLLANLKVLNKIHVQLWKIQQKLCK